jgi:site-specific DNA-methyltransferase (adenine-specific)
MAISEVYNCDCNIFMSACKDKQFDLAIVDPPYGIGVMSMNYTTSGAIRTHGHSAAKRKDYRKQSKWDIVPDKDYFTELFRISKHQIIWGMNYFPLPPTRGVICWDKCQPWDNFSQVELAWTSFDCPAKLYRISNTGGANSEKKIHETQKPIALYDNCYRDFVKEGWKVFDPYLGSGSNRISADKFGVDFIGWEIGKMHFDDQEQRFKIYKLQKRMF